MHTLKFAVILSFVIAALLIPGTVAYARNRYDEATPHILGMLVSVLSVGIMAVLVLAFVSHSGRLL